MGSANVGEGVYINTLPDIRFWARRIGEKGIVPELEIFEGGMVSNIARLLQDRSLTPPFYCNCVLGFEGPLPANPHSLYFLQSLLPEDVPWGIIHDGRQDFSLLAMALAMGATVVRVGFEDSVFLAPGKAARTNVELVSRVVELIRCIGYDVATPAEARALLNIKH
jgi:3-keto-5-aminohexanoate cleavage enzyme